MIRVQNSHVPFARKAVSTSSLPRSSYYLHTHSSLVLGLQHGLLPIEINPQENNYTDPRNLKEIPTKASKQGCRRSLVSTYNRQQDQSA